MEEIREGAVVGFLHRADGPDGLVITHGAGGNCRMPLLAAVADAFNTAGVTVLRCDLAFRQKGGTPNPKSAPADRAVLAEAVAFVRNLVKGRVFLGGQSYGGRQATMAAAEHPDLCDGLLLFSYPLHPPAKRDQLRTAHFPSLTTPAVFVHGSRDPFGSLDEMRSALPLIPAKTVLIEIDGAGHDLKRGKFELDRVVRAVLA